MDAVRAVLQQRGVPAAVFDAHMADHIAAAERMQIIVTASNTCTKYAGAGAPPVTHIDTHEVRLVRNSREPVNLAYVSHRQRHAEGPANPVLPEDVPWSRPAAVRGEAIVLEWMMQPLRAAHHQSGHNVKVDCNFTYDGLSLDTRLKVCDLWHDDFSDDDDDDDGDNRREATRYNDRCIRVFDATMARLQRQWKTFSATLLLNSAL